MALLPIVVHIYEQGMLTNFTKKILYRVYSPQLSAISPFGCKSNGYWLKAKILRVRLMAKKASTETVQKVYEHFLKLYENSPKLPRFSYALQAHS